MILTPKLNSVKLCPVRKNWGKCQAENHIKDLVFKLLDRHHTIQLKHHCPTPLVSHIFIPESRNEDSVTKCQKLFSWTIACFQIMQRFVQRDCLTSHMEESMPCTNSKQSWYNQTQKNMDYSGWQCEILSLEINLAAGQEIRSTVALCILNHV